jgi:hypothetical protein
MNLRKAVTLCEKIQDATRVGHEVFIAERLGIGGNRIFVSEDKKSVETASIGAHTEYAKQKSLIVGNVCATKNMHPPQSNHPNQRNQRSGEKQ